MQLLSKVCKVCGSHTQFDHVRMKHSLRSRTKAAARNFECSRKQFPVANKRTLLLINFICDDGSSRLYTCYIRLSIFKLQQSIWQCFEISFLLHLFKLLINWQPHTKCVQSPAAAVVRLLRLCGILTLSNWVREPQTLQTIESSCITPYATGKEAFCIRIRM